MGVRVLNRESVSVGLGLRDDARALGVGCTEAGSASEHTVSSAYAQDGLARLTQPRIPHPFDVDVEQDGALAPAAAGAAEDGRINEQRVDDLADRQVVHDAEWRFGQAEDILSAQRRSEDRPASRPRGQQSLSTQRARMTGRADARAVACTSATARSGPAGPRA